MSIELFLFFTIVISALGWGFGYKWYGPLSLRYGPRLINMVLFTLAVVYTGTYLYWLG